MKPPQNRQQNTRHGGGKERKRLTWKSCSFLSLVNDGEGDNGLGRDPLRWDELSEGEWAGRVVLVELEAPPSVPGPDPGVTDLQEIIWGKRKLSLRTLKDTSSIY